MLVTDITRDQVPATPGVYLFKTKWWNILYIWKAKVLKKRLRQYFTPGTLRKQDMVAKAAYVDFFSVGTEQESLILEINLINTHRPPYNNLIKGDTSYVYIKIANEPFPNIQLTRYKYNDKATYIGPKLRKREFREILQMLRYVFQRRQCSTTQFRQGKVCSDYFFWLCQGWCWYAKMWADWEGNDLLQHNTKLGFRPVYASSQEAALAYKDIITYIKWFFEGDSESLLKYIRDEVEHASAQQHFERAAKLRDMYFRIDALSQKQTIVLPQLYTGIFGMIERVQEDFLIILIKLHAGKMIDIISHYEAEEYEHAEIVKQLEIEYKLQPLEEKEKYTLLRQGTPRLRKPDKDILLGHASTFAYSYLQSHTGSIQETTTYLLERLQQRYTWQQFPAYIECLDISHFSGDYTAGGLVAIHYWRPDKSRYRRYQITTGHKHDDYAALMEVLVRRCGLGKEEFPKDLPDILVIDGGNQQLSLVQRIIEQFPGSSKLLTKMQFCSLGKGKARKRAGKVKWEQEVLRVLQANGEITSHDLQYDDADRILVLLRDEAHRFANAYRKKLMQKERKEK